MFLFSFLKSVAPRGCLLALFVGLSAPARVSADEATKVRLAVIGDADSRDLSALIVAELSSRPDVALVEREDLSRLGDERQLQHLAGSDAVTFGKMVGADGLLFVDKTNVGYTARFTAVGLGYALFNDELGLPKSPDQLARSLAHRLAGYAPKLRLDPAKMVPLSILNLRADLAMAQSTVLERDLTLLLESRLAAVPEYVVLERRHAWSLGFERGLDPAARPLLRGAYLIDGTLSLSAAGDDLTVALRVRAPAGTESIVSVRGTAGNLPALVDKILPEIARATGQPSAAPASTGPEAEEYLREGLWGWRSGANHAALEALDSAELLGAPVAAVAAVRIPVLYALAEEGMERWLPWYGDEKNTPVFDLPALTGRAGFAVRAVREAVRYRDEKLEGQLTPQFVSNPTEKFLFSTREIRDRTVFRASKLLFLLDRALDPGGDELRRELRVLTEYDPLHGRPGLATSANLNNDNSRALFADDWAQTLEEELAFYRLTCADKNMALPIAQIGWSLNRFCPRFLRTPAERREGFTRFVYSLQGDPEHRLSYLILATCLENRFVAAAAYRALLGELWDRREPLATATKDQPLFHNYYRVPPQPRKDVGPAGLPLLRYLLTAPQIGSWGYTIIKELWESQTIPKSQAADVWAEFKAYRERLRPIWKAAGHSDDGYKTRMEEMSASFGRWFPEVVAAPMPASDASARTPLVVTRFWHPWLTPAGKAEGDFIITDVESASAGGMWLAGYFSHGIKGRLFKIALPGLSTEVTEPPEDKMARSVQVGPDALYFNRTSNGGKEGKEIHHYLSRYDFATQAWETREMPIGFRDHFSLLHGSLYLVVSASNGGFGEKESGLARYDWPTGQLTILASSRRRPGRNQFDDTSPYEISQVFLGPGDRPCVTADSGTFYVREDEGEWPRVFDGLFFDRATRAGDLTLVHNSSHEVTLLDPRLSAPVHVMAAAEPFHRHGSTVEPLPWTQRAWWDSPGPIRFDGLAWHGDRLFALVLPKDKSGACELWCYDKNKGRQPRRVPLKFQMGATFAAALPVRPGHMPNGWTTDEIEHPDASTVPLMLSTTQAGLCLRLVTTGFWFLPYSDIDAYLASGQH